MADPTGLDATVDRVVVVDHMQPRSVGQDRLGQGLGSALIGEDVVRVAGAAKAGQEGVGEEGDAQTGGQVGGSPGRRAQEDGVELAIRGQKGVLVHGPGGQVVGVEALGLAGIQTAASVGPDQAGPNPRVGQAGGCAGGPRHPAQSRLGVEHLPAQGRGCGQHCRPAGTVCRFTIIAHGSPVLSFPISLFYDLSS